MSPSIKPIKAWGQGGPNPPKVAMILEELEIPHEFMLIGMNQVKEPAYTAINPNGRLPAIQDPNTDITLWESGAILEYLIEVYDKDHKLSFPSGSTESWHAKQWLYFQTSGQGPYCGQAIWFRRFQPEDVPSAKERYAKEINRVTGVLDGHLAKQKAQFGSDRMWLVGGKMSYADIAFIPWQTVVVKQLVQEKDLFDPENHPHVKEWIEKMTSQPKIKGVIDAVDNLYKKHQTETKK